MFYDTFITIKIGKIYCDSKLARYYFVYVTRIIQTTKQLAPHRM